MAYHAAFIYATHSWKNKEGIGWKDPYPRKDGPGWGDSLWIIGKEVMEILAPGNNTATCREIIEHHITVRQRVTFA